MHKIRLTNDYSRRRACELVRKAPDGFLCSIDAPRRTLDQNDKLWAMLTDVSVSKPEGRKMTPEDWKAVFMHACGWEVQFLDGLDGNPFPAGFRSSRMTVGQMADLITFIQQYGDQHGVLWTEREEANA